MAFNFDEQVQKLSEFLKKEAKTESVAGQSFQLGEFTCVPVIKFGFVQRNSPSVPTNKLVHNLSAQSFPSTH